MPPDAYSPGDADDYQAWWNYKSLPKFNTDNPQARKYILDVARYWIHLGVDGWRLDVPSEIDDDQFWEEFRFVVKSENPDAYLVGEIWDGDPRWVGPGSFDGLMNYPVRDGLVNFLMERGSAEDFSAIIDRQLSQYPQENVSAMYNLLGSHDTARIKSELMGDQERLKMAYLFLFAYPGAPAVYYGDEVGLDGGKDPECRKAFPRDDGSWDRDLRQFIQQLMAIRKNNPALRRGSYHAVLKDDKRGGYGFARILGEKSLLIVLNASGTRRKYRLTVDALDWKDGRIVRNVVSGEEMIVTGNELNLTLEPWSGIWVV